MMTSTGTRKVIPTPDFGISPGERKHLKTQESEEQPGGTNPWVGISFWLLDNAVSRRRREPSLSRVHEPLPCRRVVSHVSFALPSRSPTIAVTIAIVTTIATTITTITIEMYNTVTGGFTIIASAVAVTTAVAVAVDAAIVTIYYYYYHYYPYHYHYHYHYFHYYHY